MMVLKTAQTSRGGYSLALRVLACPKGLKLFRQRIDSQIERVHWPHLHAQQHSQMMGSKKDEDDFLML